MRLNQPGRTQPGNTASVVTIRLHVHGGESGSDVACLHHGYRDALFDETLIQPLRKISGFEACMLDAAPLVPNCLGDRIWLARRACFLDDASTFVDNADVRLA